MNADPFSIAREFSEKTGYQYEKLNEKIWKFLFSGKNLKEIDVFAIWEGELFIFGAILAQRQQLKLEQDFFDSLLTLNNNLDRVKIGFNQENMLFVRADISTRVLDAQEFKSYVDQISAGADYVYGLIQPYLMDSREDAE